MEPLLVEIGTEEIPAGYIGPALSAFSDHLLRHLEENRIDHGAAKVFGTPRRLAVRIEAVAERQKPQVTEQVGPPERAAFDENGGFTMAARKFAEKNNVSPQKLSVKETEKGRYVVARKTDPGRATRTILKDSLPGIILAIPFPKTMRWADVSIYFARPIHSLAALLGSRVISCQVGDVRSGRYSFGHRFLHPKKIKLENAYDYSGALSDAWVIADISRRQAMMEEQMGVAVKPVKGRVLPDAQLVETVTQLVEYPATVLGEFDKRFLELPREVLITAMREHQRYFAVVDENEAVMPYFLAVNNTLARDMALVTKGHERVLKARLEDARFFFRTDRKISLDEMSEKLRHVLFQADLGSVYDKVSRVRRVAASLARQLAIGDAAAADLDRAAWLSKSDLVSHMVDEFPKLQGVMGRIYARAAGEAEVVCQAIEEHYRPTASGAMLPRSLAGSLLSISDKIDSICGCFLVGLVPTGASDPYALRRQAIGLLQVILANRFSLSVEKLVETSLSTFSSDSGEVQPKVSQETAREQACGFLTARLAHILEAEGISKDGVAAVMAVSENDPVPVMAEKARALERLKAEAEFDTLAVGFKRVVNIIRKADPADIPAGDGQGRVDAALFEYEAESALFKEFNAIAETVHQYLQQGRIDAAFSSVATLRQSVDRFFDDVLVMSDDAARRRNRLALLDRISRLFALLADFSRIST
jgi:glycyl-tRNA synthetase beta chain